MGPPRWIVDEDGKDTFLVDLHPQKYTSPQEDASRYAEHYLLAFLNYLGVIEYEKFYESIYSVRIRLKN